MRFKNFLSFLLLLFVSLSTTACLQVDTGNRDRVLPDGGMFISLDQGKTWEQRTAIMSVGGQNHNFSLDRVSDLELDPSDPTAIYFGMIDQGLVFTYDRGQSWQLAYDLGPGTIQSIAVDPGDKCNVYVAKGNKVYKTEDCNRSWEPVFTDSVSDVEVTNVGVDHFNSQNVYLTLSRGDVVKSSDAGKSWQTLHRFEKGVNKFFIDPNDSRKMYADVEKKSLYISEDGARTWRSMAEVFEDFEIGGEVVDIELFKGRPNLIFVATPLGIIKSEDATLTWSQLSLLPPKDDALIESMAMDTADLNKIYYITGSTFYQSVDAGENWTPRSLPSTRQAKILEIDKEKPEILYLGIGGLK